MRLMRVPNARAFHVRPPSSVEYRVGKAPTQPRSGLTNATPSNETAASTSMGRQLTPPSIVFKTTPSGVGPSVVT
jgi:hypothetical protein